MTAIIGTIVGTSVALAGFLNTSLGGRISNVENEFRGTREEIRATRTELRDDIRATRTELRDIHALDARVRTVETGFARVDQGLETIERAVIRSAEAPNSPDARRGNERRSGSR